MSRTRSFTLIELLVVISIISLLASVVLASLNSARDKGRLGAIKYFATQVDHIEGDQAVGLWNFDDCTGSTTADRSGYNNVGTLINGASWSSTNTYNGTGCSISFNGVNQYVNVPNSASISDYTQGVTFAAWIYPTNFSGCGVGLCGIVAQNGGPYPVTLDIDPTSHILWQIPNTRVGSVKTVPLNAWSFVIGTYTQGTNLATIYVNGVKDISFSGSGTASNIGALGIGWFTNVGGYFAGQIDGVRIFTKDLTASEVGKLYADGLNNHPSLAAK